MDGVCVSISIESAADGDADADSHCKPEESQRQSDEGLDVRSEHACSCVRTQVRRPPRTQSTQWTRWQLNVSVFLFVLAVIVAFLWVALVLCDTRILGSSTDMTNFAVEQFAEYQTGVIFSFTLVPMLLLLGAVSPHKGAAFLDTHEPAVGLLESAHQSLGKLVVFGRMVGAFVLLYYLSLITHLQVLSEFWKMERYVYFTCKLSCHLVAIVWSTAVAYQDMPFDIFIVKVVAAVLAALQLLPAAIFLLGLLLFLNNPTKEWLEFGLTPFTRLCDSSKFVLSFVLALPCILIDLHALLSEEANSMDHPCSQLLLLLSASLSLCGAVMTFSKLDSRGYVWRRVSGIPTVIGVAPKLSFAFALVFLYRLTGTATRLLLFSFLTVAMHDEISMFGIGFGGLLLIGVDFLLQLFLLRRDTRNVKKFPVALVNMVSIVEPLLHGYGPICSTIVEDWAVVHFVELCGAVGLVAGLDSFHDWERIRRLNPTLVSIFCVCSILQWPILACLRAFFTYKLTDTEKEPTLGLLQCGAEGDDALQRHRTVAFHTPDEADWRSPMLLAREVWWPSLLSVHGTFNGSCQNLCDPGAAAVAALLQDGVKCKALWLEMNSIGDEGACCLAQAMEKRKDIQWLDLNANNITDVGAAQLASSLECREVRLKRLWLSGNPIHDPLIKARLRAVVEELVITGDENQVAAASCKDTEQPVDSGDWTTGLSSGDVSQAPIKTTTSKAGFRQAFSHLTIDTAFTDSADTELSIELGLPRTLDGDGGRVPYRSKR